HRARRRRRLRLVHRDQAPPRPARRDGPEAVGRAGAEHVGTGRAFRRRHRVHRAPRPPHARHGLSRRPGFAAAVTVVCTVLAAVTLLPALFGMLGPRVLSRKQLVRLWDHGPEHAEQRGVWARWSRTVGRFPAVLAAAAVAVMIVVSLPVLHLRLGASDASN